LLGNDHTQNRKTNAKVFRTIGKQRKTGQAQGSNFVLC
jgi:hypothetical protein